jgi:nitroimidazol reductase NimA-like FMN-containing flavoprotein (pyridoxamine 5'-phosphate oxidase superfamily)
MDAGTDPRTGMVALDRDECMRLLAGSPLGRLAVVVSGRPLIFPVNFVVDGNAIVLRTTLGTKLHGARNGPVAFECDGIDREYHTGWSVLVQGVAEEVQSPLEVERLERLPLRPWCDAPRPVWLRVRAGTVTGRRIPPHSATFVSAFEEEKRCH